MSAITEQQASFGTHKSILPNLDYPLILAALALLGLGLVMVGSASLHRISSAPFYYMNRHMIAITIGLIMALQIFQTPVAL